MMLLGSPGLVCMGERVCFGSGELGSRAGTGSTGWAVVSLQLSCTIEHCVLCVFVPGVCSAGR